jgi:hypothetical protein
MRKALGRWSSKTGPTAFLPKTHFCTVRNFCAQICHPCAMFWPFNHVLIIRAFYAVMVPCYPPGVKRAWLRSGVTRRALRNACDGTASRFFFALSKRASKRVALVSQKCEPETQFSVSGELVIFIAHCVDFLGCNPSNLNSLYDAILLECRFIARMSLTM